MPNSAARNARLFPALDALAASGDYEDAAKLASATAAFLQSVGVGNATVFINQASNNACTAHRNVLDAAINTSVDARLDIEVGIEEVEFC